MTSSRAKAVRVCHIEEQHSTSPNLPMNRRTFCRKRCRVWRPQAWPRGLSTRPQPPQAQRQPFIKPRRLSGRRFGGAGRAGKRHVQHHGAGYRKGIAEALGLKVAGRRTPARSPWLSGRPGSRPRGGHQPVLRRHGRFARCCRSAAAGEAVASCRISTTKLIRRNPKIVLGYSDITALLPGDLMRERA